MNHGLGGHNLYIVGLHRQLDPADKFLHDLVLAGHDLGIIKPRLLDIDTVVIPGEGIVIDLCTVKKSLGRDATLVEADSAK